MRSPHRSISIRSLAAALLAWSAIVSGTAAAQDYPTKPVRMIVPFGPGTTTDIVARVVADGLSKTVAQPVIVENRAGAGGVIGTEAVAKSAPDGYTLAMGTVGTHAINVGLFRNLPYDPINDFVPVALVGYTPTLLVVPHSLPAKNVAELVALAKARPEAITFASAGNGTSGHLAGELLKARSGAAMLHVPYKEGAQALTDVIAGQVQFMFYHPAAVLPHIKSGKLRAIGVSSARRSAAAPEVPTIAEQGFGDFDLVAWFALYAPTRTPAAVIARLRDSATRVLASTEVTAKLAAQGVEQTAMGADELATFARTEAAKWADLVKRSGAQVD
jgi:tripartite-type tricarboxylate transporter receptor subunit TctC